MVRKTPKRKVRIFKVNVLSGRERPHGMVDQAEAASILDHLNEERNNAPMSNYFIGRDERGKLVTGKVKPKIPDLSGQ